MIEWTDETGSIRLRLEAEVFSRDGKLIGVGPVGDIGTLWTQGAFDSAVSDTMSRRPRTARASGLAQALFSLCEWGESLIFLSLPDPEDDRRALEGFINGWLTSCGVLDEWDHDLVQMADAFQYHVIDDSQGTIRLCNVAGRLLFGENGFWDDWQNLMLYALRNNWSRDDKPEALAAAYAAARWPADDVVYKCGCGSDHCEFRASTASVFYEEANLWVRLSIDPGVRFPYWTLRDRVPALLLLPQSWLFYADPKQTVECGPRFVFKKTDLEKLLAGRWADILKG